MRYSFFGASLLLIYLGCSLSARAEERTGVYVGASLGEATNESGEFRGSDTAFKLVGGYACNDYFGVEIAYVDAGTQRDSVGVTRIDNESSGIIASAPGRLPLGDEFAVFGKLRPSTTPLRPHDPAAMSRAKAIATRRSPMASASKFARSATSEFAVNTRSSTFALATSTSSRSASFTSLDGHGRV